MKPKDSENLKSSIIYTDGSNEKYSPTHTKNSASVGMKIK